MIETETEARILAMAIDCEGSIGIKRSWHRHMEKFYYQPAIQISNTNRRLIDYLVEIYPHVTIRHTQPRNPKHSGFWTWVVKADYNPDCLFQIKEYLIVKKEQAGIVLDFYDDYQKQMRNGKGRFGIKISDEMRANQDLWFTRINKLNRKGHDNTKRGKS